jgi:hypothetical protein
MQKHEHIPGEMSLNIPFLLRFSYLLLNTRNFPEMGKEKKSYFSNDR